MRLSKVACVIVCFLVLASNAWSMLRWNEARGVYDDVCYLRQAHLFQRFGLAGFDTDISRDDDRYLVSKLKEIGFPTRDDATNGPCHTPMPASGKLVIQYPPGTGAVLALFPEGHQVIPLYVLATAIVFALAVLAISTAALASEVVLAVLFGCLAIYLMINPAKASYSVEPTMVTCALVGYLTARWMIGRRHDAVLLGALGVPLGLSVTFRLPNLFLSAGYFLFLLGALLSMRTLRAALDGLWFGLAFLAGHGADAGRERNQRRQSAGYDLWWSGRDAARFQPGHHLAICRGSAVRAAAAGDCCSGVSVRNAWPCRHQERRAAGCGQYRRQSPLLPQPSRVHALLYGADRHAVAVEPSLRLSAAAGASDRCRRRGADGVSDVGGDMRIDRTGACSGQALLQ